MERLTADDSIMLWADERWPQEIGAVGILDGAPLVTSEGTVRVEAVRRLVAARLHRVPGSGSSCGCRRAGWEARCTSTHRASTWRPTFGWPPSP